MNQDRSGEDGRILVQVPALESTDIAIGAYGFRSRVVNARAEVDGHRFEVRVHGGLQAAPGDGTRAQRPARPAASARASNSGGASLSSPIQGTVVRVAVAVGDTVERGQLVCVVEAMKMENDITAHRDGVLTALIASPGMAVRVGDTLAEIG